MSKTVAQIYGINPTTTIANTDLIYMVQSPYTPGTDTAILGSSLKALFLQPANNLSDLTSASTARSNLGLSSIATASPPLSGTLGGTGVNNGASTLTLGGNLTTSGAFASTFTMTGITTVTFPTSGTLATTSQIPSGAALTKTDDTNVTLTLGGSPTTALVNAASLTLGWSGLLAGTRGGTGVNNGTNTITVGGNLSTANSFTTSGNFAVTQTYTNTTNVTFPTSGTLATTAQIPTPAALTKVDDTNVTLTLGGTPSTALLQATSITAGWTGTLSGTRGGTGVNNGASTITIGGNVTFSGAFTFAGTLTGNTSVTFPTSGTLATTSQLPTPAALTKTDDTNVTLTLGGTPSTALLQATSITAGWTGTLAGTRGGTGVNNGASTITIGGNVTYSGAFTFTGTLTNTTSVTFPTSGTLATTSQLLTSPLTTKGDIWVWSTTNDRLPVATGDGKILQVSSGAGTGLAYSTPTYPSASGSSGTILRSNGTNNVYSTSTFADTYTASNLLYSNGANTVTGLATANNGVLVTNGSGVPSISSTLPAFTTSSITFSPTTGGIVGTTTNDDAAAGKVGEYSLSSLSSAVSFVTSTVYQSMSSLSLTAGDWDVKFSAQLFPTTGTTTLTGGLTLVVATPATVGQGQFYTSNISNTPLTVSGELRFSLSTTTTVYLSGAAAFSLSAPAFYSQMSARRVR